MRSTARFAKNAIESLGYDAACTERVSSAGSCAANDAPFPGLEKGPLVANASDGATGQSALENRGGA